MLVAFGASIARDAGDTVFTGTLARGLVTGLAGGAHGMAIALCGGNTQQEGQGERGAGPGGVAALAGSRASAAALPAALVARLQPSPQLALDLRPTTRPASHHTDLKQRWHLAERVHVAVAWGQRA